MHYPETPPLTRSVALRGFGFAVGVALAGLGVWLIVTGTTQKRLELGALAGFWGLAIGALSAPGSRRHAHARGDQPADDATGTALELRSAHTGLEHAEETAARRAHELRLEHMLRHEIQASVSREVDALRAEIAELRSDLLEKVGGQLRLERTETTRVIGSNLEALQHEMRQLKYATQDGDFGTGLGGPRLQETGPIRKIVEPARVRPVSRQTAEVEADVQPARASETDGVGTAPGRAVGGRPDVVGPIVGPIVLGAVQPLRTQRSEPPPAPPPEARPAPAEARSAPEPRLTGAEPPAPAPPVPESRAASEPSDAFASLPRIRPFTEFELDPIDPPPHEIASLTLRDFAREPGEDDAAYTGRRRRSEEEAANGRHVRAAEAPERPHHHAAESTDDLLARLLARDS